MFKFTTLYRQVDDPQAIETFFSQTHLPLSEQLPDLVKSEVSRVSHKPGGQSRFYLMYELYFETKERFLDAWSTPTGVQLIQALQPWADARIITWFFSDSFEEEAAVFDEEE